MGVKAVGSVVGVIFLFHIMGSIAIGSFIHVQGAFPLDLGIGGFFCGKRDVLLGI